MGSKKRNEPPGRRGRRGAFGEPSHDVRADKPTPEPATEPDPGDDTHVPAAITSGPTPASAISAGTGPADPVAPEAAGGVGPKVGSEAARASGDPVENLLAKLEQHNCNPRSAGTDKWTALCPSHEDKNPSLSVARGDDGRALLNCFGGCPPDEVCKALGMTLADLFPPAERNEARPERNGRGQNRRPKPKKVYPDLESVTEALAWSLKKNDKKGRDFRLAGQWDYSDDSVCLVELRFEAEDGGKEYRTCHAVEGGFSTGDPAGPLPLYRLAGLKDADQVYLVEGPKCGDVVLGLGLTATTTAHGARSPKRSDWKPLAGKERVVILADNDKAGEGYVQNVLELLARLTPPPHVTKVLRLADLWQTGAPIPVGGDVAEWVQDGVPEGWSPAQCREALEAAADAAPAVALPSATGPSPSPSHPHDHARPGADASRDGGPAIAPGTWVMATDREEPNYGRVVEDHGERVSVHFVSPAGYEATVSIKRDDLRNLDGRPLTTTSDGEPDEDLVRFLSEPPEPLPVRIELPPVPAMTPEMIPVPLRDWLADIAERMQCPLDYPVVGAVVALATVVGRQITVRPKQHDIWTVVPNLWGGIVGRPGTMKTPALQAAQEFLDRFVAEAQERYTEEVARHQTTQAVKQNVRSAKAAAAKDALKKAARKTTTTDEALEKIAADAVPHPDCDEDEAPTLRRYKVNDPGVEKLGEILRDNTNGLLLFRDELTGWLKTLDKHGHESDRAFYLESWDGRNSFTCDRIERGTVFIPALVMSILGGIQPGPLGRYLRGAATGTGEEDDGLIQRFQLLVYPDKSPNWKIVDRRPDAEARDRAYTVFKALDGLDVVGVGAVVGDEEAPLPYLNFRDDAQALFYEWWAGLEAKIRSEDESPGVESHLSKYRSLLPSLALLFHLVDVVDGDPPGHVSLKATEMAVAWCTYLEAHMRRVYSLGEGADIDAARVLSARIKAGNVPSPFTPREVAKKGWSGLKRSEDVSAALAVLEANGWVIGVQRPPGPEGGRPSTIYHINPRARRDAPQPPKAAEPQETPCEAKVDA
jgi:putative DNA primase/helicase